MKRNTKRLPALLLAIALCLSLLPGTAWAAEPQVIVNGVDLVTDEDHTVQCGKGTAVYAPETSTLTLNNATIGTAYETGSSIGACGIYADATSNLTLVLKGTNTVENTATPFDSGVYIKRTLTVEGDGSLTAVGKEEGIIVLRSFTINSGTVRGTATGEGLSGSYHSGVRSQGDLTINGGTVTGIAEAAANSRSFGVKVESGSLYINRGTVTGEGANGGIRSERDIAITGTPTVTAKSGDPGNAISAGDSRYYQLTVNEIRFEPLETATEFKVVNGKVTEGAQIWTPAVWVNGVKISANPGQPVQCDTGFAKYDPQTQTLTLNNATIDTPYEDSSRNAYGIYAEENLTLELVGDNTVQNTNASSLYSAFGVCIEGSLTVSGGGTLTAAGKDSGIMAGTDLTVSGGTITGSSSADDGSGIFAGNDLTVSGSGSVKGTATGGKANDGIYVTNTLTVSGSGSVEGTASGISGNGIWVENGALTVSGSGSVKGTASGISGNGISVMNGYTTVESGSVEGTATGNGGNGISVRFLDVKSGTVTGANNGSDNTYGRGISVSSTMTVSGGTVTGTSNAQSDNGIHVTSKELAVSGGTVTGTANGVNGYGIYADNGNILITGNSNVTATSETAGKTVEIEEDSELLVGGKRYAPSATDTVFSVVNGQVTEGYEIWTPDIWVNNERISTPGNNTVNCGTGTAVYAPDTNTLTLTGAAIDTKHEENITGGTEYHSFGIYADSDLTLVLAGENTVQNTADPFDYGVYVDGSLTVKGTGRLTAGGKLYGIYVEKNMTAESGTVKGTSTESSCAGIGVRGALMVSSGSVEGTGTGSKSYGIAVDDTMTVTGGSVGGTATGSVGEGIYVGNTLTASGSGSVTGTATGEDGAGIYVDSNLTVSGSSTVTGTAAGEDGWGIDVEYGSLTVKGGTVTGEGDSTGIYPFGLTISSGSVTGTGTGEGDSCGIDTTVLNLRGGTVTGKGGNVAILTYGYGVQTAEQLIVLAEDCVLDGYEAQAVVMQAEDYGYDFTYASFVKTGDQLKYDADNGFVSAVKEITLTASDKPDDEPEEPGTDPDEPSTDPGGDEPGTDPGDQPGTSGVPSGSDKDDGYSVSVPASSSVRGGAITVSPRNAEEGDTVTVTVKPDEGYELEKLTVTDSRGSELTLTDRGSSQYSFTMPGSSVKIQVSFRKIAAAAVNPFTDVAANAYYYDAVLWAVANGITNGTTATTFSPNAPVTRAQMVTFLWRAHGAPGVDGANPFTDVSAGAYYYDAVLWAVASGITNGTTAATFSPNAPVTRAQAVTFQWRTAGAPALSGGSFADVAAGAYYANAVTWAVANGITNGTTAATFSPNAPVTRAQAVTFLYRELA